MKNVFIVLEGIDGSGKGEAIKRLSEHYSAKYEVLTTTEPTDGRYGMEIRMLLKDGSNPESSSEKLTELFIKDREEHVNQKIIPFLKDGENKILICDRYYYSTLVYQSLQGISLKKLFEDNKKFPKPDICFILDLPAKTAIGRVASRGRNDKFEQPDFMKKLRETFLELPKMLKEQIKIVDSSKGKEEVFDTLKREIDNFIISQ